MKTDVIKAGISVLDDVLPNGIPRRNMIFIAGEPGTAKSVILQHLAYNFLSTLREPIIFLTLEQPAHAIAKDMVGLGWDIEKFVNERMIKFIDCFSFRIESKQTREYIEILNNPKDMTSLTSTVFQSIDKMDMNGRGAVFIDSLTELFVLEREKIFYHQILEEVKTWRANGPKERNVLFFATHHYGIEALKELEQSLNYVIDGIIDVRFEPKLLQEGILERELRVRKMRGVFHDTRWIRFRVSENGITKVASDQKDSA